MNKDWMECLADAHRQYTTKISELEMKTLVSGIKRSVRRRRTGRALAFAFPVMALGEQPVELRVDALKIRGMEFLCESLLPIILYGHRSVEAFGGFERMAQFERPLRGGDDDEIGHVAGHVHDVARRRAVDDDELVVGHGFAQSFQLADIGGVHGERHGLAGVLGVAGPCGGVALGVGVQHGYVAAVPCGGGGQSHGGGGFAAAAFQVDDRNDHGLSFVPTMG